MVQNDAILGLLSATPSEHQTTNNYTTVADIFEVEATLTPHEYVNSVDSLSILPGSSVGIANGYGLDGPGIEFRWGGEIFLHLSRPALAPTQPPVQWVPGLCRGKERPGRDADPSPPSGAVVMKG